MDSTTLLQSLDLSLPSPAYIAGAILFGLVGMAAFAYGKRTQRSQTKWIGVALMLYPYAISRTWLLYLVGGILCAGLFIARE